MKTQTIAEIVEQNRQNELGKEHGHQVALTKIAPRLFFNPNFASYTGNQISGNRIAELMKNGDLGTG